MSRLFTIGLFAGSLLAAAPGHAGLFSLNQPGSTCHPSNELPADYYQYDLDALSRGPGRPAAAPPHSVRSAR